MVLRYHPARTANKSLFAAPQLISFRTNAAASLIAFSFPNATWHGMYFMPQSDATTSRSAGTCFSPLRALA
jgi:hypothetical protein